MANIAPTGSSLQGIKSTSVLDMTVSTLKETLKKLSGGLNVHQGKGDVPLKDEALLKDEIPLLDLVDQFTAHVQGLSRAAMSANDGIAIVQVVDAGLRDVLAGFKQQQELAAHGADPTHSDQDRQALQNQAQRVQESIENIIQNTRYNDIPVLATNKTVLLQTSVDANTQTTISLRDYAHLFTPVDLTSRAGSEAAQSFLKENVATVDNARVQWAAQEADLVESVRTLETMSSALTETGVRVQEADLVQAISHSIADTIRANAYLAIQTQANQSAVKVQSLLS